MQELYNERDAIKNDLKNRDTLDSGRAFAPLKPANDSILLDTSDMDIDEVVTAIIEIIDKKIEEIEKNG